jgi:hypothetical protein
MRRKALETLTSMLRCAHDSSRDESPREFFMSPDRDSRFSPADEPDEDFEDDAPRSIFAATWVRVVLVVLVLGVIGAVAVPYVLDVAHEGVAKTTSTSPGAPSVASPPTAPSVTARPAVPPSAATTPAAAPSPLVSTPVPAPAPKPPAVVAQATKPEPAKKPEPSAPPAKKEPSLAAEKAAQPAPTRAKAVEGGDYFVQVGAFKDAETAKRVATRLRDQNYPVDESVKRSAAATTSSPSAAPRPAPRATSPGGPDRYDVIVSGGTASEINTKLAGKGLASEPVGDGVRIRPGLSLRDAVALSKDLSSQGFKVQVRRGSGASAEATPVTAAPAPASETGGLYRVRVGGYPDRATALTVLRELQDKGYQPFIAKGRE